MHSKYKISSLLRIINQYKDIVLYGNGTVSNDLQNILRKYGIFPQYIIVTEIAEKEIGSIYPFNRKIEELKNSSILIIIAVGELYEREIELRLQKEKIHNYLLISEYIRKADDLIDLSDRDFIMCISAHMHENELGELDCINNSGENRKRIVFGVGLMSPRIIKIGKELCKHGYEIITIFCPDYIHNDNFETEINNMSSRTYKSNCVEEFIYYVLQVNASIVHMFTCIDAGLNSIYTLLQHKKYFGKIVFDEYDMITGMDTGRNDYINVHKEEFCLEESDGICERGYWTEHLKEKGYRIKGKNIIFFDYIDEHVNTELKESNELSIYCAGGLPIEEMDPDNPMFCLKEFINICEINKCHLHYYPNSWNEEAYSDHIKLSKELEYYHLHRPLPFSELIKEISQYDFGCMFIKKKFRDLKRGDMLYNSTNKVFDSLAAGLPFIGAAPVKFVSEFKEKGLLLDWAIEEIDFNYLRENKAKLKQKVEEVREEYYIENKIQDLISFYQSMLLD